MRPRVWYGAQTAGSAPAIARAASPVGSSRWSAIVTGGEKVYPTEVERVLGEHPAVREVAVLGLPDARFGESVCAVLVPRPGERIDFHELDALCRSRLAGYKRPRRYEIVAALPRNASDKVDKGELRLQFINDTAERSRA